MEENGVGHTRLALVRTKTSFFVFWRAVPYVTCLVIDASIEPNLVTEATPKSDLVLVRMCYNFLMRLGWALKHGRPARKLLKQAHVSSFQSSYG